MQSTKSGKSVVDIHSVIRGMESKGIDPSLILPLHALSGCDTVASCFGVGKIKALAVIKDHSLLLNLQVVGDLTQDFSIVLKTGSCFVSLCFDRPEEEDFNEARSKVWHKKTASSRQDNPKLESLPPTENSLIPNLLRTHYHTAIWRSCGSPDPPSASPEDFGWYQDKAGRMLPKMFDTEPNVAPNQLLNLIKCQCHSLNNRCGKATCSCKKANLMCTSFCGCNEDGLKCTRFQNVKDIEDSDSDDSDCENQN